jgi:hypothetical protein
MSRNTDTSSTRASVAYSKWLKLTGSRGHVTVGAQKRPKLVRLRMCLSLQWNLTYVSCVKIVRTSFHYPSESKNLWSIQALTVVQLPYQASQVSPLLTAILILSCHCNTNANPAVKLHAYEVWIRPVFHSLSCNMDPGRSMCFKPT